MNHLASPAFWQSFKKIPQHTQTLARDQFQRMKENLKHPSLHLKKVGRFWSVRVGLQYRALAVEREETLVWFWIGTHAEYDRLING
jgi:mRNA-degrading endonuclease RelE of RelBE toxin-antitoxin system